MPDIERNEMTGGEVIVEILHRFGVTMMFGLPGDQTDIYDALWRRKDIRHILVRHEQAAAHMADSYARATGRVGVCDAAVGPGATNLIGGIAEAFTSGIPVIAIISDIRSDWCGRGSFQEIDQVSVFRPVTKMSIRVDCVTRIPESMSRAFQVATTGRPGPVLLDFPIDVLKANHAFSCPDLTVDERYGHWPAIRTEPAGADISAAIDMLLTSRQPVILAGGGVLASRASAEVQQLAETLDMPVATTFMGKGTIAENHPLALGPFGSIGRPDANRHVLKSDLALALGTRFTNVDTAAWRIPGPDTRIIQVDIDPCQIGRNLAVQHALPGDIRTVLRTMLGMLKSRSISTQDQSRRIEAHGMMTRWRHESGIESPVARESSSSPVHPLQIIRALRNVMDPQDVIICDSGYNQIWGGQYFELHDRGRKYMGPRGFGIMGFSLPAAISYALARPGERVVALCGDGGFAMVLQELETALREGANITICIMNNAQLHFIRDNQKVLFNSRYISTAFTDLDFASIARSFGCTGIRVKNSGQLETALNDALASDLPAVVDVRTSDSFTPDRMNMQRLDQPE